MCGFVAILGRHGRGELARMAARVAARGPDDRGSVDDGRFAAIHHRLSIIGPDARGRQPMTVDGVTVVFNGCIYNYRELRHELEADGVSFHSDTDTEVLPHLYLRDGETMFERLNGMFAIVLWDAENERLLAARDPFGEKPLFVCAQDGRAGFASTLAAFEAGDWRLTPDAGAVREILTTMRLGAPRTMYREARQLPPGCMLVMRPGETPAPRRYAGLPGPEKDSSTLSWREAEAELGARLDAVFIRRMVADRPLGVFLSGGVDSSLIAESLARQSDARLHTFSVRFADGAPDYDESGWAGRVARHIGSEHQVLEVRAEAREALEALARDFDQPVANSAALPTWLIARAAKAHVDVALSGVGGDELFGGYPRYLGMAWHARLRRLPGRGLLLRLLQGMGDAADSRNVRGRARRFLEGLDRPIETAWLQWTRTTDAGWREMFTLPEPDDAPEDGWRAWAEDEGGLSGLLARMGPVNGAMAWDRVTYLPDDLLAVGDRMSMAHALELRAPFLDRELADWALGLPAAFKVGGAPWREGLKRLLKAVARKRLPPEVVDRPKQGFMAPVKHWLRGPLAADVRSLAGGAPLGGLLRPEYVRREWARHEAGEDRSDILWGMLLMDAWMRARDWRF